MRRFVCIAFKNNFLIMKKLKYQDELIFFLVIIGGFTVLILVKIFLIK